MFSRKSAQNLLIRSRKGCYFVAAYQLILVGGFFERLKMLLCKVCERAAESILDELALCALKDEYPERLSTLIDGLIDLTDFRWEQEHVERGRDIPENHIRGGSLVYGMLFTTFIIKHYARPHELEKYAKLIIRMCEVNNRFKQAFIMQMENPEGGIEAYRFELGDSAAAVALKVLQAIK